MLLADSDDADELGRLLIDATGADLLRVSSMFACGSHCRGALVMNERDTYPYRCVWVGSSR